MNKSGPKKLIVNSSLILINFLPPLLTPHQKWNK